MANVGHIAVNRKKKKFSTVSSVFMSAGREREREIYDFQRGGVIKSEWLVGSRCNPCLMGV